MIFSIFTYDTLYKDVSDALIESWEDAYLLLLIFYLNQVAII